MSVRTLSALFKNASLNKNKNNIQFEKCHCNENCFYYNKTIINNNYLEHIDVYKCGRFDNDKIENNIKKYSVETQYDLRRNLILNSKQCCDYYKEIIVKKISYEKINEKQIEPIKTIKPKTEYYEDLLNKILIQIEAKLYPLYNYTGRLNDILIHLGYKPIGEDETIEELKIRLKTKNRTKWISGKEKNKINEKNKHNNRFKLEFKYNNDLSNNKEIDYINKILFTKPCNKINELTKTMNKKLTIDNNNLSDGEDEDDDDDDDDDEEKEKEEEEEEDEDKDEDENKDEDKDNTFDIENLSDDNEIECISDNEFSD